MKLHTIPGRHIASKRPARDTLGQETLSSTQSHPRSPTHTSPGLPAPSLPAPASPRRRSAPWTQPTQSCRSLSESSRQVGRYARQGARFRASENPTPSPPAPQAPRQHRLTTVANNQTTVPYRKREHLWTSQRPFQYSSTRQGSRSNTQHLFHCTQDPQPAQQNYFYQPDNPDPDHQPQPTPSEALPTPRHLAHGPCHQAVQWRHLDQNREDRPQPESSYYLRPHHTENLDLLKTGPRTEVE